MFYLDDMYGDLPNKNYLRNRNLEGQSDTNSFQHSKECENLKAEKTRIETNNVRNQTLRRVQTQLNKTS